MHFISIQQLKCQEKYYEPVNVILPHCQIVCIVVSVADNQSVHGSETLNNYIQMTKKVNAVLGSKSDSLVH